VKTDPSALLVKRRYSDFALLRDILIQRYPGMYIPNLPESTTFNITKTVVMGNNTDINSDFVRSRLYQLNCFLRELNQIPFIICDSLFEGFISIREDFKSCVDMSVKSSSPTQSPGSIIWRKNLEAVHVSSDVDNIISNAKRQIESLRSILKQYETQCLSIERQAVNNAKEVNSLSAIVSSWTSLETEFSATNASDSSDIVVNLKSLKDSHDTWSAHSQIVPRLISHSILHTIQFQTSQVDGFREFLQYRENLIRDLSKAEKEVVRALEEKSRMPSNSGGSPGFSLFGGSNTNKVSS
jgi:hypothetical protein